MLIRSVSTILIAAAIVLTFSINSAKAGFPLPPGVPAPPHVNVRIDGYLPAPPGVNVQMDSGRPYYVERDRRVYIEREKPAKHKKHKKHKKEKKHHEDNGNHYGHDKHEDRGHDKRGGHGR